MQDSVLSYAIQISWLVIIVLLTMSFSWCLDSDSKLLIGSAWWLDYYSNATVWMGFNSWNYSCEFWSKAILLVCSIYNFGQPVKNSWQQKKFCFQADDMEVKSTVLDVITSSLFIQCPITSVWWPVTLYGWLSTVTSVINIYGNHFRIVFSSKFEV
jgi:hypothetical protein